MGALGRIVTADELEHAATEVLLLKILVQKGLVVLYALGILVWTFLLLSGAGQEPRLPSLKSTEGVGLLLLLFFGTFVLLIRGMGRLRELSQNRTRLLEYWSVGTRITEDHDAWQRYKQLSAVDKIDSKIG